MRNLHYISTALAAFILFVAAALPAYAQDEYPRGSLAIGVHPIGGTGPVCFTLTDPLGRRMSAGPPCEAEELSEIPYAYQDYEAIDDDETGAPGSVTRVIYVAGPVAGVYGLMLSLPQDWMYDLEAQASGPAGGTSHRLMAGIKAEPGSTRTYAITYAEVPEVEIRIEEMIP